jgi:hypothetical protein
MAIGQVVTTFSNKLQGRTFGAPGRPARADLAKYARAEHEERERLGGAAQEWPGGGDHSPQVVGSLARFLLRDGAPSRAAARRADAPHRPLPAPRRNAPWVPALRELAGPVVTRQILRSPGEKSQLSGPERRALSGSAPPASTVLRIPLRRAVDPGDLGRPSGPDGEGQAKGQARNARGEPLTAYAELQFVYGRRRGAPTN